MSTSQKKSSLNELPNRLLLGDLVLVIAPSSRSIEDTSPSAKGVSVETSIPNLERKNSESSVRSFCFVGEMQPDKTVFWYYSPLEGYEKKKLRVEESVVAAAAAHNAYRVDAATCTAATSALENSNLSLASVTHVTQIFLRLDRSNTFREYYVAEEQNAQNKRDPSAFSPAQFTEQNSNDAAPAAKEPTLQLNRLVLPPSREEDVPVSRPSDRPLATVSSTTVSTTSLAHAPTPPFAAFGPRASTAAEYAPQPPHTLQPNGSFSKKSPVLRAPSHARRFVSSSKDTLTPSNSSSSAFLSMSTGTYYIRVNASEEAQGQTTSSETATRHEGVPTFRPAPPREPNSLSNSGSRPLSRIPSHRRPNLPLVPQEAIENK